MPPFRPPARKAGGEGQGAGCWAQRRGCLKETVQNKVLLTPWVEWSVWRTCSWRQSHRAHGSAPARQQAPAARVERAHSLPSWQVCARQTHWSQCRGKHCSEWQRPVSKVQQGPKRQALPTETAECSLHTGQTDLEAVAWLGAGGSITVGTWRLWGTWHSHGNQRRWRDYSDVS